MFDRGQSELSCYNIFNVGGKPTKKSLKIISLVKPTSKDLNLRFQDPGTPKGRKSALRLSLLKHILTIVLELRSLCVKGHRVMETLIFS